MRCHAYIGDASGSQAVPGLVNTVTNGIRRSDGGMHTGQVRVIVVIVVHPRQLLLSSFGGSRSSSVQDVQKSSISSTEVTENCLTPASSP